MKYQKILVTGGAGFIGSFLVDELIKKGYYVRIFDNLEKQVHQGRKPTYLNKKAEFVKGDVRDYAVLKKAVRGMDAIFHLAAAVGVGQSNYEVRKFTDVNVGGMANLLDILVSIKHSVRKVIVNSSMTGLGEGCYMCNKCGTVRPPLRSEKQLKRGGWELNCPNCDRKVIPISTDEYATEYPNSIYAITKKAQQDMLLLFGKTYSIPTVALRCFNVYGPRQSLSNPYTGVTAIFISRIKNSSPAVVYENGMQTRDFVSVHDVVRAMLLALEKDSANNQIINIGSGRPTPILEIAQTLEKLLGKHGLVKISKEFRKGDIRHCFANITKAQKVLGWKPEISLAEGFKELVEWSGREKAVDRFAQAEKELKARGLQGN